MEEQISILIVEDELIWIQALSLILNELGFSVVKSVSTVEDALTAFSTADYDLILLDINLNGKNSGVELGKVINRLYQKPFIFITSSDYVDIKDMAEAMPSAYLRKPVNTTSLFIAIQNAINNFSSGIEKPGDDMLYSFFVKQGNRYKKINWNDVVYLSAGKNYVSVFNSADKTDYYIRSSLQRIMQNIIPKYLQGNFIQVNRSEIIQRAFIQELVHSKVVTPYKSFAVTDLYHKDLKSKLNIL